MEGRGRKEGKESPVCLLGEYSGLIKDLVGLGTPHMLGRNPLEPYPLIHMYTLGILVPALASKGC